MNLSKSEDKSSDFFNRIKSMALEDHQNMKRLEKFKPLILSAFDKKPKKKHNDNLLEKIICNNLAKTNEDIPTENQLTESITTLQKINRKHDFLNTTYSHTKVIKKNKSNFKKFKTEANNQTLKNPKLLIESILTDPKYKPLNHQHTFTSPFSKCLTNDEFISKQIQRLDNLHNLFTECDRGQTNSFKIEKGINKIKLNQCKHFKLRINKSLKKVQTYGEFESNSEIKALSKNIKKTMSNKNYVVYNDFENKTKVLSASKNNVFERFNLLNKITYTSALFMKDNWEDMFFKNNKLKKENNLHFGIKRSDSFRKKINLPMMKENEEEIKRMVFSTQRIKHRIISGK